MKEVERINGKILLATDGSLPALVATNKAIEMAHDKKARLIVLNVAEQSPITSMEKLAEDSLLQRPPGMDGIEYARKAAAKLGNGNGGVEFIRREGPVAGEIVKMASEKSVDTIVIGTSDPRGIDGFMLGNIAEAVVRQAPCNVLVIKPAEAEIRSVMDSIKAMAGPASRVDISDFIGSGKFKIGLGLFALYIAGYGLFTVVGSFEKSLFSIRLLSLNVALVSGMLLICVAIVMAIAYNWYVGRAESAGGA